MKRLSLFLFPLSLFADTNETFGNEGGTYSGSSSYDSSSYSPLSPTGGQSDYVTSMSQGMFDVVLPDVGLIVLGILGVLLIIFVFGILKRFLSNDQPMRRRR